MRWPARAVASVSSVMLGALLTASPAVAATPEVWTTVEHNVTLASETFPDDICGPRAVTETVTNTVQVNHLTANGDGSFHFVDFETGMLVADYTDPAISDQTFRRTDTEVFNLTPGGTFIQTETFRQFDATLQIRSTYHLTVGANGEPRVEHFVGFVRGCP
jgi:hypothetical protein